MDEKTPLSTMTLPLPITTAHSQDAQPRDHSFTRIILIRLALAYLLWRLFLVDHFVHHMNHWKDRKSPAGTHDGCKQFPALSLGSNTTNNHDLIFSADYRKESVAVLAGLVQIHRESFDDNGAVDGDNADPRWTRFYDVAAYLQRTFPLVHEKMNLATINTHGLVFTWTGSDESLKPLLLMAHQDTVPVNPETIADWTHPPWSGHYDGTFLWGRGASDCGNSLSATLEAATLLLQSGFVPKRTIIFAFGFDEESKGFEGAGQIAPHLEKIYGKNGIEFIVDEGGLGIGRKMYGASFASPSTSEKGYLDVKFSLATPGGHSSVPPAHTGIGMMAQIVSTLESSPYSPSISLESPVFALLQCAAEYGDLPRHLASSIKDGSNAGHRGENARQEAAERFAELDATSRYLVSTSQAVDIISGGVKVNALPETVTLTVNYRVSVDSMPHVVREKIVRLMRPIAHKFALDVTAFGAPLMTSAHAQGHLTVVGINELNPAPVSPRTAKAWELLSSTIQHVYRSDLPDLIVAPSIMTGNTDTRFMWSLSKNIYRFTPMDRNGDLNIHTVNEKLNFNDHISGIWFFHELIRNADAFDFD